MKPKVWPRDFSCVAFSHYLLDELQGLPQGWPNVFVPRELKTNGAIPCNREAEGDCDGKAIVAYRGIVHVVPKTNDFNLKIKAVAELIIIIY